jgi:2OG-Fe(II) oxygenase superfamily
MAKNGKKAATAPATKAGSTTSQSTIAKTGKAKPLQENLLLDEKTSINRGRVLQLEPLQNGADVYIARNFLSLKECRAWIDFVEQSGGLEFVSHPASRYVANRECSRWQRNDWDLADKIFQRLANTGILQTMESSGVNKNLSSPLSRNFPRGKSYQAVACNGNLRLYKYEKGMSFGRHIDECNSTERGQTEVTILIYLSDCQGGATRFHTTHNSNNNIELMTAKNRTKRKHISSSSSFAFVPETGSILLHVHGDKCLEHEADPVLSGIKYVLRTDLVYAEVENNKSDDNR